MPIGLEELHERMSSLQPRPERNRRQPGDEDDEQRMQGDLAQLAIARAAMAQQRLERAQAHATDEVGVRDHPAGARPNGEASGKARRKGQMPARHLLPHHQDDRERRAAHGEQERHVDRGEEQVAVQEAGQQAQGERRQPSPVPDREPCHRHDGGEPSEAEQEGHGVPDRDRARELKRPHGRDEHLKPRSIHPQILFDRLELRPVRKGARVPGKRLGAVIVGVEFVGRQPVIRGGRKPDDQGHAQHKEHEQRLGMASSKCEAEFRPRKPRAVAIHPFKRHALSLIGCMTTHWCRPECGGNSRGGIASHMKLSD